MDNLLKDDLDLSLGECPITAPVWLSIATSPFLFGLMAWESLTETLIELGQASEEVFRGDRLPVLHLPEENHES